MNSSAATGALLREVARLYVRAQREVADCCGSTSTQCHLLMELGRGGELPMTELGARLGLEKSWVSRAVDALVAEGLVLKTANLQDARSWLVRLSAAGRRRFDELNRTLDAHAGELLAALPAADRATVDRTLALLLQALRQGPDIAACCAQALSHTPARKMKSTC